MKQKLKYILKNINILQITGTLYKEIKGISSHSNLIKKDYLFIAIKGEKQDGHKFIDSAIKNGATVIIYDKEFDIEKKIQKITYVLVKDSFSILGMISSNFYDDPTSKINLIGITGTNGKTSTAYILYQLFSNMNEKSIIISTIDIKIIDEKYENLYTTPNIIIINKYLYIAVKKGCKYAFIEVTSHGIKQKRIDGLLFRGGIFTNITHDHIDYHKSFTNYLKIKKSFFKRLSKNSFSLINADDVYMNYISNGLSSKKYFYGIKNKSDFNINIIKQNFYKSCVIINQKYKLSTKLIGKFNAYNLLAGYATACILGAKKSYILKHISNINPVLGRVEQFISDSGIRVIVDYAHNPDGLKNILTNIREIMTQGRLICIIGCGGNRDKYKRSKMGKIAYDICDISIFTTDNPREENPVYIINDMCKFQNKIVNFNITHKKVILTILDRKEAIYESIRIAKKNDVILIAGKGHENYQEVQGKLYNFNDMKIVKKLFIKK